MKGNAKTLRRDLADQLRINDERQKLLLQCIAENEILRSDLRELRDCFPIMLRKNETARRVGLSVRHLERLEKDGKFPRRVKLSEHSAAWVESEVAAWIDERILIARAGR